MITEWKNVLSLALKKSHLFPLSQIVWVCIVALQTALSLRLSVVGALEDFKEWITHRTH